MATLSERLDRMVELQVAPWKDAGRRDPYPYLKLGDAATENELDDLERAIGRMLPTEVRELYKWHNGCVVWLVPDIGFRNLGLALSIYEIEKKAKSLPRLSNSNGRIEPDELFTVLDVDKPSLCVRTTLGERIPASPVYLLDVDQLTMVSKSLSALIEHFIGELEAGHVELTEHGIRWASTAGAFSFFDRSMVPYGA
jgi:hypothetical protein